MSSEAKSTDFNRSETFGGVFVSYASQDTAVADAIVSSLEGQGLRCWVAPRDVRPGTLYADAIVRAINEAKVLVLVLSANAIASSHVGREVERAASKRKQILAFRIDDAPLSPELEYFLSNSQWINAITLGTPIALASLADAVRPGPALLTPAATMRARSGRSGRRIGIAVVVGAGLIVAVALALHQWLFHRTTAAAAAPADATTYGRPDKPGATTTIPAKSMAVLPFADMSEKKDQEYFADGMAEEILDLLTKVPGLKVIGRTSSFQFKGRNEDLRRIGSMLDVSYILEGSVRRSSDRLRITAQLIDTRDGAHLWSDTYDREIAEVFSLQDDLATAIVRALQISVADPEAIFSRYSVRDPDAYDEFLRGLFAFDRLDENGCLEAIDHFQRALILDPSFASAAAYLGLVYDVQGQWGFVPPALAFERARSAANTAISLDANLGLPHTLLASIHDAYDWDWAAAGTELEKARRLAPRNPLTSFQAGLHSMTLGNFEEALKYEKESAALDPFEPVNAIAISWIQQRLGHLAEAEVAVRRTLEISPTYVSAHYFLGAVLLARGQLKLALEEMKKESVAGGQHPGVAIAYYALGRKSESRAALEETIKHEAKVNAFGIAEVYAFRGEHDAAVRWLERAYAQKDPSLYYVKGDPFLKKIEADPQYLAFLKKMNLSN